MRILVTGARGQLGSTIVAAWSDRADVIAMRRDELDIADSRAVGSCVDRERPDVIVNCAAYNAVDAAEDCPADALRVNAIAMRALARASSAHGAVLVQYSSDFVFDGTTEAPYREDDEPSPRSVYGMSKLLGEWFAADTPRHYVLRVASLFGGGPRASQIDRIAEGLLRHQAPSVFVDRIVTPSYAPDVAAATWMLLTRQPAYGTYHCVNGGPASWFDVAQVIAARLGVEPSLTPVHVSDVPLRASRPRYAALAADKLAACGVPMPAWSDAVGRYVRQYAGPSSGARALVR